MKAVVAAFNQEKALVGAFSVITNLRMDIFEALRATPAISWGASSAAIVTSSLSTSGHRGLRGHNLDNANNQNHLYARNAAYALEEIPNLLSVRTVMLNFKANWSQTRIFCPF